MKQVAAVFLVSSLQPLKRLIFVAHLRVRRDAAVRREFMPGFFLQLIDTLSPVPSDAERCIGLSECGYLLVTAAGKQPHFDELLNRFRKHSLLVIGQREMTMSVAIVRIHRQRLSQPVYCLIVLARG